MLMVPEDAEHKVGFWIIKIMMKFTASKFMSKDLIEIICILERGEKRLCIKLYETGIILLSSIISHGEWRPLKNASCRQTTSHQDK